MLVPAMQFLYSNFDKSIGHYRRYDRAMMRKNCRAKRVHNSTHEVQQLYWHVGLILLYQATETRLPNAIQQETVFLLSKIYSRFVIPIVRVLERFLPVPMGLNLTVVLEKP